MEASAAPRLIGPFNSNSLRAPISGEFPQTEAFDFSRERGEGLSIREEWGGGGFAVASRQSYCAVVLNSDGVVALLD